MVRKAIFASLLALLAGLPAMQAGAQEIETSVDRTELARGETLTFTIRVYDRRQGMQLDLTPLTEQFDVLGTRTSSQIRSVNGNVESWTDYIVTLFPLTEGNLTIPAIEVNESLTEPIDVLVRNEGARSNQGAEELFLELEANKESIYVQEQLLFSVRLYYTINGIRNPQFTELEIPDTVTQLIGSPNQYETLIDGVRYGVYEKRYVIFPQRSGSLAIPDILFRGEVTDGSSNFVFRNLNTRRVTAFTEGMTVEVKERPESARDSEYWLPLRSLALEESWTGPTDDPHIGDTLVRTIAIQAEGLDGAVLPPLTDVAIPGANIYPEPSEIERVFVDGSIVGTRIERKSIVAIESGPLEIPEIVIPWWNVETDRQEVAIIPATTLAWNTSSRACSSSSSTGLRYMFPALLIRASSPPPWVTAASIMAVRSAAAVTSPVTARPRSPSRAATSSTRSGRRPGMVTRAPRPARCSAAPAPMPEPPPVINKDMPSIGFIGLRPYRAAVRSSGSCDTPLGSCHGLPGGDRPGGVHELGEVRGRLSLGLRVRRRRAGHRASRGGDPHRPAASPGRPQLPLPGHPGIRRQRQSAGVDSSPASGARLCQRSAGAKQSDGLFRARRQMTRVGARDRIDDCDRGGPRHRRADRPAGRSRRLSGGGAGHRRRGRRSDRAVAARCGAPDGVERRCQCG